ncbi:DUF389 domain-containing protein [Glutamicibacter sp. JL.03c]|uniref:DUF389 domain-containing protein n=1 Tax=Glutamicibacter sp. JL.03c TaxID=2984842 RepID=UPI0021F7F972|nr:DUF389 domain-containing protein [Glutamicibacter sp. JL.03c]UYQ77408.1 DUF389 domain-containing protein [Glutamicibacter sp. JL.03c]
MTGEPRENSLPGDARAASRDSFFASIWNATDAAGLQRMRERLYLSEGLAAKNLSTFCVLLFLSAVIATAGVVADSTATVIGAMIVAPLMTPILGTALALTLANRKQIVHNIALVAAGSIGIICIAYLIGLVTPLDVTATTSS